MNRNWQRFATDYLAFSKKARTGILCILGLAVLIYLVPFFTIKRGAPVAITEIPDLVASIDSLKSKSPSYSSTDAQNFQGETEHTPNHVLTAGELFRFDPNTLSVEGWQRLGLREKTSRTIEKYRSKGGKFRKPEDIKKIWGMPAGFYDRVKNYIYIAPDDVAGSKPSFEKRDQYIPRRPNTINVNAADTAEFIQLPGIGSKLAMRIVKFRNSLGGFHAVEQLGEVYGLPDSTFQKIKPYLQIGGTVKKINVNTATKDQLKAHPYIKWQVASAIVEYRSQHGNFNRLEDLERIVAIDAATVKKISPYLEL